VKDAGSHDDRWKAATVLTDAATYSQAFLFGSVTGWRRLSNPAGLDKSGIMSLVQETSADFQGRHAV